MELPFQPSDFCPADHVFRQFFKYFICEPYCMLCYLRHNMIHKVSRPKVENVIVILNSK